MKFQLRESVVQRIGYSFYASLPMSWVEAHSIHKGSRVSMKLDEKKRLVIEPATEEKA